MYASNNNAVLIDDCHNLQNLSVLLEVTEDVATTDGNGWSVQLNCYPPPGEYCQTSQLAWLQYMVVVQGGSLAYYIQYWSNASTWPPGYTNQPGTAPWLPCWPYDWGVTTPFASISGDTLPRESRLQIALGTNDAGSVNKVTFTYTDPDGNDHSAEFDPPAGAVHPVAACELNFVGPPGGTATFTQGLTSSRGIIYYSVSSGQLTVQSGGPGAACGEVDEFTAETSNMTYSDINGAPASTVTQILQQPVACAIDNLFPGDQARLGQMRRIRDRQLAPLPAGQWLIEMLGRHSADLAARIASDEDLARVARGLLTEATEVIRQGRSFDATTIDHALDLLKAESWRLPPSLHAASQAGETLLESLRGRTFEDGLRVASKTILPRFRTSRGAVRQTRRRGA